MTANGKPQAEWRQWLDPSHPVLNNIEHEDIVQHSDKLLEKNAGLAQALKGLQRSLDEPYKGITTDDKLSFPMTQIGNVRHGVLRKSDDNIPIEAITAAANNILEAATEEQRKLIQMSRDSRERRIWSNMHMYTFRFGIRLGEVNEQLRSLVLKLLETTMSPEGYQKAITATEVNAFLGNVVKAPQVLNRYSYNFALFGEPSLSETWGWVIFGHHLCMSFTLKGKSIVISPVFTGAEPNVIDEGPLTGTRLFVPEQDMGLKFVQGLSPGLLPKAQLFDSMNPPDKPKDTQMGWTRGTLFQDNRIVPTQGICLSEVDESSQSLIVDLVEQYIIYLPATARKNKLDEVRAYISETWFCWVGGTGNDDPFYYRIQSSVILCELEHVGGIFLANKKPEKFHTHTQVRIPNGGDYGFALEK